MSEIDPVILEIRAEMGRYRAELKSTTALATAAFNKQAKGAADLERQIRLSSDRIRSSLQGLVGSFAAAFSTQQIIAYADAYTRFTNQLKVAGVEGANLARTQENLFGIAQKYGIELESLGTLFSRGAQVSKELGASQADLLQFITGVSAALKIQGTSASESRGALLQLSQLLASGTVRAEEFNSVNEGALPILQAVAKNIDAAGGSVGKLKLLVNDGKVSSQEFFAAFLKGTADLQTQAEGAALTIGNAFTILNNALGKYIGEADQSLSATERVSAAIIALSKNLDTLVTALALIGAVLLGRVTAGLLATAGASGVASAAMFALQARAIGAATSMEALAFAGAAAGRTLLAAFGGPVGLAVTALAVGIYYLANRTDEASQASAEYAQQQTALKRVLDKAAEATDRLATATGKARVEALANAEAVRQETIQYIANARAALEAARAKAAQARQNLGEALSRTDPRTSSGFAQAMAGAGGSMGGGMPLPDAGVVKVSAEDQRARANLRVANANLRAADVGLQRIEGILKAPPPIVTSTPGKSKKGPKPPKGRDPDEIARRFVDDLERGLSDLHQAQADAIGTVEARQKFELERIETERLAQARAINANKDYSKAQKVQLLELNDQIAAAQEEAVLAERRVVAAEDALVLRLGDLENERALLEAQGNLAETAAERRDIELRLLDLQYKEERLRLDAIANNERLNDAEREGARRRIAGLDERYALDRQGVERQNEGAGRRYQRELYGDINEQIENIEVQGLRRLEDHLVDTTKAALGLKGALGDVVGELIRIGIQRQIIGPLADSLFGPAGGGGGGSFGSILSSLFGGGGGGGGGASSAANIGSSIASLFGRSGGGYIPPNSVRRVNEGSGRGVELLRMGPQGGQVIPLGQTQAARPAASPTIIHAPQFNMRGAIMTRDLFAEMERISNQSAATYSAAVGKQVLKAVPARMAQFQGDGT